MARSADEANIWITGLSCLIAGCGNPSTSAGTNRTDHFRFSQVQCSMREHFVEFEYRQQMRDRWLHDVFAAGSPSSVSEMELSNQQDSQLFLGKSSIDEEEAVRLLSDQGISEDKAKVRLQV